MRQESQVACFCTATVFAATYQHEKNHSLMSCSSKFVERNIYPTLSRHVLKFGLLVFYTSHTTGHYHYPMSLLTLDTAEISKVSTSAFLAF